MLYAKSVLRQQLATDDISHVHVSFTNTTCIYLQSTNSQQKNKKIVCVNENYKQKAATHSIYYRKEINAFIAFLTQDEGPKSSHYHADAGMKRDQNHHIITRMPERIFLWAYFIHSTNCSIRPTSFAICQVNYFRLLDEELFAVVVT